MEMHNYGKWIRYRFNDNNYSWAKSTCELPPFFQYFILGPQNLGYNKSAEVKFTLNGSPHNLDGPALISVVRPYFGSERRDHAYYIHGVSFKKDGFDNIVRKYHEGIPIESNLTYINRIFSKSVQFDCFGTLISVSRKSLADRAGFNFLKNDIQVWGGDLFISSANELFQRVRIPGQEVISMAKSRH